MQMQNKDLIHPTVEAELRALKDILSHLLAEFPDVRTKVAANLGTKGGVPLASDAQPVEDVDYATVVRAILYPQID